MDAIVTLVISSGELRYESVGELKEERGSFEGT